MATTGDNKESIAMGESNFQAMGDGTQVVEGYVLPPPSQVLVEVIAPSDLQAGYQMSVDVSGKQMTVIVPEGGVKQGAQFKAAVVNVSNDGHNIPLGQWRDDTCDCCNHGCCHPFCCLTFWMTPLALGQLLTRMKLDWFATPISPETQKTIWSAFRVLLTMFVAYQVVDTFIYFLTAEYVEGYYDANLGKMVYPEDIPTWVNILDAIRHSLSFAYGFIILLITIRARTHIRGKYNIPETKCIGCEDFCCSFWCSCCTICQMARHTADYSTYSAACCSETGLNPTAPEVV